MSGGDTVTATFTVTNTGKRAGADVPQVYLTGVRLTKRRPLLEKNVKFDQRRSL